MRFTPEEIEIAQSCKTADELVAKAKAKGVELSVEHAQFLLDSAAIVEIDESDIKAVSGGCSSSTESLCPYCYSKDYESAIYEYSREYHGCLYKCNNCLKGFSEPYKLKKS